MRQFAFETSRHSNLNKGNYKNELCNMPGCWLWCFFRVKPNEDEHRCQ